MARHAVQPNVISYTSAIEVCAKSWPRCLAALLPKHHVGERKRTYDFFFPILVLCHAPVCLADTCIGQHAVSADGTSQLWNAALFRRRQKEEAESLFRELLRKGVQPDTKLMRSFGKWHF